MKLYGIECYVAVPLKRRNGECFGTLCALDPSPAEIPEKNLELFGLLAELISWQLEAEERHARSEAALLDAQETALLRERFIGILGHDLRSPLNAVSLNAEMLMRKDDLPAGYAKAIQRIASSTQRVTRMVADLLDFARGRLGGGMPIRPKPATDVRGIVQNVVEELETAYPTRSIQVQVAPGDLVADWDEDRMAQAVSNLVGNALQHSPPNAAVTIRVGGAADYALIEVHNEGPPIPVEVLSRIFDPFRRGPDTPGRASGGLGLGLYIAKQIIDAHHGVLEVTSTEELGTTFTARLPGRLLASRRVS